MYGYFAENVISEKMRTILFCYYYFKSLMLPTCCRIYRINVKFYLLKWILLLSKYYQDSFDLSMCI